MRPIFVILIALLLAFTVMFIAGCSGAKPLDEPIALSAFSYSHNGMSSADGYYLSLTENERGLLFTYSLNCGSHEGEFLVEGDCLRELGSIAAEYRIDRWDGFDKVDKRVSDGEGFTLRYTAKDGSTCTAHGSNAFPNDYDAAMERILPVFHTLFTQYAPTLCEYLP